MTALSIDYHRTYAFFYLKMNRLDKALTDIREALRMLEEVDYEDISKDTYDLLSQIHEARKEYEQALKYERLSSEAKFKIYNNFFYI